MSKKKKKHNSNNKSIEEKKQSVEVKRSRFEEFINKKWIKISIHIISAYIWINFIVDMSTFTSRGTYPNIFLSILALATFILEWTIIRPDKK